jgi:hypothetical protein
MHAVGGIHRDFGDLGTVTQMAGVSGDSHARAPRVGAIAPVGFLGNLAQHAGEPFGFEARGGSGGGRGGQDFELQVERIAAGGKGKLIEE